MARKAVTREANIKKNYEIRHNKQQHIRTHETKPMGKQYIGANKKGH